MVFIFFIFFLLVENLLLPSLVGPGPFFITPVFLLGLLIYRKSNRIWLLQVVIFGLLEYFVNGIDFKLTLIPMVVTAIIYIMLTKFINFDDQLKDDLSFSALAGSAFIMLILSILYSGSSILIQNSFDPSLSWHSFKIFLLSSGMALGGWSLAFSVIFKFIHF